MAILWIMLSFIASQDASDIVYPVRIVGCIEDAQVSNSAVVDTETNPYYLRGDFDGNGQMDFAIAVKGKKTKRNGVLVCLDNNSHVLIGGDKKHSPPFSDMPDDNFVAPHWEVATRQEILAFRKTNQDVPTPSGESILMIWEDGIHYIYWDGKRFRWSPMML